jgi:hypothetical protein
MRILSRRIPKPHVDIRRFDYQRQLQALFHLDSHRSFLLPHLKEPNFLSLQQRCLRTNTNNSATEDSDE